MTVTLTVATVMSRPLGPPYDVVVCAAFVALTVIGYLDRGMTGAVQTLAVGVIAWLAARLMVHRWLIQPKQATDEGGGS